MIVDTAARGPALLLPQAVVAAMPVHGDRALLIASDCIVDTPPRKAALGG